MDYFPTTIYGRDTKFWPLIDDRLRKGTIFLDPCIKPRLRDLTISFLAAIERGVRVKLLLSHWDHTRKDMFKHLKSITDLDGMNRGKVSIEGKLFKVMQVP